MISKRTMSGRGSESASSGLWHRWWQRGRCTRRAGDHPRCGYWQWCRRDEYHGFLRIAHSVLSIPDPKAVQGAKGRFRPSRIEGINGVLDFVRFRPALPTEKTPDGSEGSRAAVLYCRMSRRHSHSAGCSLRTSSVSPAAGMLKGASGYAAMACPAAARTLSVVVT